MQSGIVASKIQDSLIDNCINISHTQEFEFDPEWSSICSQTFFVTRIQANISGCNGEMLLEIPSCPECAHSLDKISDNSIK